MALSDRSLFLYGFEVTELNRSMDFRAVALETPRLATLRLGFYSLSSLAQEIVRAMQEVDPANEYEVTIDRTQNGGLENRVTISTNGTFLEILFASGIRAASSCYSLIGFVGADLTGATSYTGTQTAGTTLVPTLIGYNFQAITQRQKIQGAINKAASGDRESVVYQRIKYWRVEFKYEPKLKIDTEWEALMGWMIEQKLVEFTPEISSPNVVYEGYLDSSPGDGKGLGFEMKEMLPEFPNFYTTGSLVFQQRPQEIV